MFLFDIGMGLAIASLIGLLTRNEFSVDYLFVGVFGSLVPDVDMIIYLLKGNKLDKWAHRHRDISHYPFITVPILAAIAYYFFGLWRCIIQAIAMACHYLHDIPEPGWGIRLFYPISKEYIAYRSRDGIEPPQWYAWTKKEQDALATLYGDDHWIKNKSFWTHDLGMFFLGVTMANVWMYIS